MTATKFCKILDFLTPCPLVRTRQLVSSRKCTHPPLLHALYQCLLPPWREHRVTFPRGILSDLDGTQVRLEFGDLPPSLIFFFFLCLTFHYQEVYAFFFQVFLILLVLSCAPPKKFSLVPPHSDPAGIHSLRRMESQRVAVF